ncbi:MAG: GNAT family N-acetyltransferase [Acholeplasma sp.]|jgi:ElaA protein|nr:MAG: GNAT family N-acetyltransferase [Acholeplasma sp.]
MSLNIVKKTFNQLTNQELYQILDLRGKVFVMEQRILYLDTDYKDQKSIHYMIFEQDKLISYLRLVEPGYKFKEYAISRVLTDPLYRKKGLATKLIQEAMQDIKGLPIRISGQAYLKSYYEGLGFHVVKGPYVEEDILHYEMLSLNNQ